MNYVDYLIDCETIPMLYIIIYGFISQNIRAKRVSKFMATCPRRVSAGGWLLPLVALGYCTCDGCERARDGPSARVAALCTARRALRPLPCVAIAVCACAP